LTQIKLIDPKPHTHGVAARPITCRSVRAPARHRSHPWLQRHLGGRRGRAGRGWSLPL